MQQQALQIRVTYPDSRVEDLYLESDNVLIGSAAHCEVRLPEDQSAPENVLLQLTPAGPSIEARSYQPAPTLNGATFSRSQLLPDTVVGVGAIRIQVWVVQAHQAGAKTEEKKKGGLSPVSLVALVLAIPAAYMLLFPPSQGTRIGGSAPREIPDLWAKTPAECSQKGKDQAIAVGVQSFEQAEARAERRPFRVRDGVAAVPLYEEAAACFRLAQKDAAAKQAGEAAAKLRESISDDYRNHRVRMEHALDVADLPTVHKEARVLLEMTSGQDGDYIAYLSALDRQLTMQLGRAKKR